MKRSLLCFFAGITMLSAADVPPGRKAEQQSCIPCHSLRLIDTQRLSAAAWQKEVDKMIGWGAVVPDRQLLIDYLSQNYGKAQPSPSRALSADNK